jgi:hypothetical protein
VAVPATTVAGSTPPPASTTSTPPASASSATDAPAAAAATTTTSIAPVEPRFPLSVADGGRHLLDVSGRPFLIRGEAAWSLISNLTMEEVVQYLDDRRGKEFTAVLVNLLEHKFAVNAPANRQGDQPFSTAGDFSTPNDAYFEFAQDVVRAAQDRGFAVLLTYMYLGHLGGEGWSEEIGSDTNTESTCRDFGRYVGQRFAEFDNIVWVAGGDATPAKGSPTEQRLRAMQDGLREGGAHQLATAHWDPGLSTDVESFLDDLQLNAIYWYGRNGDGHTYDAAREAAEYTPPLPAFLIETGYEPAGFIPGDPASIRKYEYWAFLSGGTAGGFYGHRDIWLFATEDFEAPYHFGSQPWQQSLDAPGAFDFQRFGQVLESIPWFRLLPQDMDGMRRLVVSKDGEPGGDDYVAAAATPEGDALLAYLPNGGASPRTIDVDLSGMQAPLVAEWVDPSTNDVVDAGQVDASGATSFTTPGANGAGTSDWVLRSTAGT